MNLDSVLKAKNFFRFTGPPEHWLTAIKFMTWGLEDDYKERWSRIRPGDIFFIHSTQKSYFKNAKSGIIGLGVVGSDFSIKKNNLWMFETMYSINKWPLLVPLSEVYLFSELPSTTTWDNPAVDNIEKTKRLVDKLLIGSIPLNQIRGFPQMGSFSSVSEDVAYQILNDRRPLYLYTNDNIYIENSKVAIEKSEADFKREFDQVKTSEEAMRYADTLKIFTNVKTRIIREPISNYSRDNEILDRANLVHQTIVQQLIDLFRERGYDTLSSPFVDLFAHNESSSFLFEVKSTENKNFRSQARKGIAQLLEYEYFDVGKFANENNLTFKNKFNLIVPSKIPLDTTYVEFINSLKIGVAMVGDGKLEPIGKDLGFSNI